MTKNPFKPGDVVKCIDVPHAMHRITSDGLYVVRNVVEQFISLANGNGAWHFDRFELVTEVLDKELDRWALRGNGNWACISDARIPPRDFDALVKSWGPLIAAPKAEPDTTQEDTMTTNTLTDQQVAALRRAEKALRDAGLSFRALRLATAFPEAYERDDLEIVHWESGQPTDDLIRVANMPGAHVVAEREDGVGFYGPAFASDDRICNSRSFMRLNWPDWTITVTAPKPAKPEPPADPTGGDPVVMAALERNADPSVLFRATDERWSLRLGWQNGAWETSDLHGIRRLHPETIADLMGGEQA